MSDTKSTKGRKTAPKVEVRPLGRLTSIYGLIDPRTGMLRYIGKANDPRKRLASHLRDSVRRMTPVYAWIRKLLSLGMQPEMLVLSECENWQAEERRLIASARARGYVLLNVAEGGDEPHCSTETRAENGRKVAKLRVQDERAAFIFNAKRSLGIALRKGRVSEATKAKMRLAAQKRPDLFGVWANI